jgi:methionyl-tRNA formyltransferase
LKIYETELPSEKVVGEPGTVVATKDTLTFACADGSIEVKSIQLAGKKRMTTAEFLRGFKL